MEKDTGCAFRLETALRHLLQDVIRSELRPLQEQIRQLIETLSAAAPRSGSNLSEVLTVPDVAKEMQVIPATVRGWIHSGALKSARLGTGTEARRTYRVLRSDLEKFVAASRVQASSEEVDISAEVDRILARDRERRRRL